MITEDLLKKHFVHDTLSRGIHTIYETQEEVIRNYLQTRTGTLLHHIGKRPFTYQEAAGKRVYYMRILTYLRYLDIRYRRGKDRISRHIRSNLALYNRVVWGVLYQDTFPELRYGFTAEVRAQLRRELEEALQTQE